LKIFNSKLEIAGFILWFLYITIVHDLLGDFKMIGNCIFFLVMITIGYKNYKDQQYSKFAVALWILPVILTLSMFIAIYLKRPV
jgi:hypothetical protein